MLSPSTFESFRVYSLDTVARLREALDLIEDVEENRLPRRALDPVISELNWSLKKDPVAQTLASPQIAALAELTKDTKFDLQSLFAHVVLLHNTISSRYKNSLEQLLLELFADKNNRSKFRQAIGFYCSHLINIGYTRFYINEQNERLFFHQDRRRTGRASQKSFFEIFDGKPKQFNVQILVPREFGIYLQSLGFTVKKIAEIQSEAATALRSNLEQFEDPVVLERKVDAYDPYGARQILIQELTSLTAITYLDSSGMSCQWGKMAHVARHRSNNGQLIPELDTGTFPRRTSTTSGRRLKRIRRYTERILDHFDDSSTERLLSSISTAALARNSTYLENQLISLWSAVEVLLRAPVGDITRIVHYANLLVPCVVLRHPRRLFIAMYDELILSYRRKFSDLVSRVPGDYANPHSRFIALLTLAHNQDLRKELCDLCSENPLALHRLWKSHKDYSTHESVLDAILAHAERVEWQIHRIYRARNQLVHAGKVPSYLESIIANLREYYTAAVTTIVRHASKQEGKSDIDQVVAEIGIAYCIVKRHFQSRKKEKAPFLEDDLAILVDT